MRLNGSNPTSHDGSIDSNCLGVQFEVCMPSFKSACSIWSLHAQFEVCMLSLKSACSVWSLHAQFEVYMVSLKSACSVSSLHAQFQVCMLSFKSAFSLKYECSVWSLCSVEVSVPMFWWEDGNYNPPPYQIWFCCHDNMNLQWCWSSK